WLITRLRLPPFIATMGTLAGLRSAAELITRSVPITCPYPNLRALGSGLTPLAFFAVTAGLVAALMRSTVIGRQLTALGGNEEAARLSGLPTARLKAVSYLLSALLASLAGLLYTAYNGQGDPRAGVGYELQAIAAVVVGGCSLTGGVGSIAGVALGVVLMQVTLNGIFLVVRSNSTQWQGLVVGVVVILAVALNNARSQRPTGGERART
ncbi:MAG: ABC transporter permease, partial [Armatimonadetes bacterium]|nr:ABC transporter permease [Armatimonadota bacterium]